MKTHRIHVTCKSNSPHVSISFDNGFDGSIYCKNAPIPPWKDHYAIVKAVYFQEDIDLARKEEREKVLRELRQSTEK